MSQSLTKKEHSASPDKVTKLVLAINVCQSLVRMITQKYLTTQRYSVVTKQQGTSETWNCSNRRGRQRVKNGN